MRHVCWDGLTESLEQLRSGFSRAELVARVFTAGIGMRSSEQLGLGVLVVALPFLGCPPRFGVESFLGSDSRPGLPQDFEGAPGHGSWLGGLGTKEC